MLLKDRVAIVTGAAVGIGRGIALKFAEEGCSVVVADISDALGIQTAKEASQKGKEALFVHCNVTDNRQVQDMVQKTISKYGKIDILVNNAGGVSGTEGSIEDITEELWDKILDLNLKSQFLCCKAVVPLMKEKKYGKIVNIASIGATFPPTAVIHYHSAKAGVLGLTVNLAFDLAESNICVNAIIPGPIRTPFWAPLTQGVQDEDAFFTQVGKVVPLQRVGTPEDIAGAALFFASDLAAYVTGQYLHVAGGQPLNPKGKPLPSMMKKK